jgi:hypothetical protein
MMDYVLVLLACACVVAAWYALNNHELRNQTLGLLVSAYKYSRPSSLMTGDEALSRLASVNCELRAILGDETCREFDPTERTPKNGWRCADSPSRAAPVARACDEEDAAEADAAARATGRCQEARLGVGDILYLLRTHEAATEAPWHLQREYHPKRGVEWFDIVGPEGQHLLGYDEVADAWRNIVNAENDARFIEAARNLAPRVAKLAIRQMRDLHETKVELEFLKKQIADFHAEMPSIAEAVGASSAGILGLAEVIKKARHESFLAGRQSASLDLGPG